MLTIYIAHIKTLPKSHHIILFSSEIIATVIEL